LTIKTHIIILFGLLLLPARYSAQDQESAEISLEAHSDAFQEHFFGALKEKAVENYEKAINLLLECKKLQPGNEVIDHELSKNHLALRHYDEAKRYVETALAKDPANLWYKETLFHIYDAQNNSAEALSLGKQLAPHHPAFKENLIALYEKTGNYKEALHLLETLKATRGLTNAQREQHARYQDLINGKQNKEVAARPDSPQATGPFTAIQNKIDSYQASGDYGALLSYIEETLETYPAQSTFYYVKGKTLNHLKKHNEAITVLETALDFWVEDTTLRNNIYKELMLAYQASGNTEKAAEYGKKLKNGTK